MESRVIGMTITIYSDIGLCNPDLMQLRGAVTEYPTSICIAPISRLNFRAEDSNVVTNHCGIRTSFSSMVGPLKENEIHSSQD